jgi:NB-ARC domain
MVTVRASRQGLIQVDRARRRKGWLKQSEIWCRLAQTSRATLKRFWRREAIEHGTFIALCQTVGLVDWEAIAELDQEPAWKLQLCLNEMPDVSLFLGRVAELSQLTDWSQQSRLIVIWGMGGMGKTSLMAEWVESLVRSGTAEQQFEAIVWRSLQYQQPSLTDLTQSVRASLPSETPSDTDQLSTLLQQHRILLILDHWETLLGGASAGKVKAEFADFSQLLQWVGRTRHPSCVIAISNEKPAELALLEENNPFVQSHKLTGLATNDAIALLHHRQLQEDSNAWKTLIQLYRGHPLALNMIASLIQDLCQGSTADFLSMNTLVIHQLDQVLAERIRCLSTAELDILDVLAQAERPLARDVVHQHITDNLSQSQLIEHLVSLGDRCLLEILSEAETVLFALTPVVQKYVRRQMLSHR